MNKELFGFLFVFLSLIIGALYYSNTVQAPVISSLNYVRSTYHKGVKLATYTINRHINQSQEIQRLTEQLEQYENNHLVMQQLASEVNDLFEANKSPLKLDPKVELVRAIAYEKFGNFNRLWIDMDDYNSSKVYGIVYKEIVAGIVINKNERPLALLNTDSKSTYAVQIGSSLATGIAQGDNKKHILVKYIPAWFEINKNDEVVTSGLDKVFFKGLKVGKVLSVTKEHGFQTALVEPYYTSKDPSYFHMIRKTK